VSREMVGYADLDQYGSWQSYPDYGAGVVSDDRGAGLGAVPRRLLDRSGRVGPDVGRSSALGVCALPLRPLGPYRRPLGVVPRRVYEASGLGAGAGRVVRRIPVGSLGRSWSTGLWLGAARLARALSSDVAPMFVQLLGPLQPALRRERDRASERATRPLCKSRRSGRAVRGRRHELDEAQAGGAESGERSRVTRDLSAGSCPVRRQWSREHGQFPAPDRFERAHLRRRPTYVSTGRNPPVPRATFSPGTPTGSGETLSPGPTRVSPAASGMQREREGVRTAPAQSLRPQDVAAPATPRRIGGQTAGIRTPARRREAVAPSRVAHAPAAAGGHAAQPGPRLARPSAACLRSRPRRRSLHRRRVRRARRLPPRRQTRGVDAREATSPYPTCRRAERPASNSGACWSRRPARGDVACAMSAVSWRSARGACRRRRA
jgi:hypothetical protein